MVDGLRFAPAVGFNCGALGLKACAGFRVEAL